MILNNADNIMLGSSEVDRVYCGNILVWERNSSPLPEGYTQLNYIQSSGAQWLDPQMAAPELTDTVQIQCGFSFVSLGSNWQGVVSVGNPGTSINDGYSMYFGADSSGFLVKTSHPSGSDATSASPVLIPATATDYDADITLGANSTGVTVDGTSFVSTIAHGIDIPLLLFASRPSADWGYTEFSSVKMYYCRIYANGVLVHNLLPCSRNADSKIGMYDIVAGAFRTNGGSGADFTGG